MLHVAPTRFSDYEVTWRQLAILVSLQGRAEIMPKNPDDIPSSRRDAYGVEMIPGR